VESTSRPLILDTGALYAYVDRRDPRNTAVRELLRAWAGELVVSAFTAAEADYLILDRLGLDAEFEFLRDLAGAYTVEALDPDGLLQARDVCAQYADLRLGLADASMVVLADRWRTRSLATFDERHFRAVRPLSGGAFELLPDDSRRP
jgi:predicted nucleic acid-binding protein